MKENDLLEQKLRNQEEDFRLQNEALMRELAQVQMHQTCIVSLYSVVMSVLHVCKFLSNIHVYCDLISLACGISLCPIEF